MGVRHDVSEGAAAMNEADKQWLTDSVVEAVREDLRRRSRVGIKK